jgi:hypothetical protein
MSARPFLFAAILLPILTSGARAGTTFESSKLSPGVVVQVSGFQSSKHSAGVVLQGTGLQSSKMSPGVVLQNTSLQSSKISVGIVFVAAVSGGGNIPRAPLTHW